MRKNESKDDKILNQAGGDPYMLWIDFLNSEWHDWRGSGKSEDRLEKSEWIESFLQKWGISAPVAPEPDELSLLKQLRTLLRSITEDLVSGKTINNLQLKELNDFMARGSFVSQMVTTARGFQIGSIPSVADWQHAAALIALSFAKTLSEKELSRIRICENSDCRWVFYDDTRNRSKKFCDDKMCGNLIKVRRFRAKQKEKANGDV